MVKNIYALPSNKKKDIPSCVWVKCSECSEIIYSGELSRNLRICPKCEYYFPLEPAERIALLTDEGKFCVYNANPDEAICDRVILTGETRISGHHLMLAALNLNFINEAIGSYICEKIVRTVSRAADEQLPLLLIYTSGDGRQFSSAHILSISAAIGNLTKEKLLYISVLAPLNSHYNFPGFAYIADIVIAESNVEGNLHFSSNRANRNGGARAVLTLFQHGMLDMVVSRRDLKHALTDILNFFC